MEDLISVVIPFYSNKGWLDEALMSVVGQTYNHKEILVIDDGSKEDISDLCEKYKQKIKYIRKENGGPASARNCGIENARGKYIAFLDSDDVWYPNKLESQIAFMKKNNLYWSQHCYEYFNENGVINTINTSHYTGNILPFLYTSFKVQTSCFMMKTCVFNEKVKFDEKKRYGEDAALYKQLSLIYPLGCDNKVLAKFRIRENNAGFNPFIQFASRADTWKNEKNEEVFKKNTNCIVRLAYKYCYYISFLFNKIGIKNIAVGKIFYALPWLSFRLASKKLEGKKDERI